MSGGGTGGHIFPAIAIANAIKAIRPDTEFLFVGAEGRMEMEKVPAAGYAIEGLWISGLQRKLTADNLSFPFKIISSLWKAKKILKRFQPDIAIGTGGYASGPMLKVASGAGIPTLIQEQNSYPGITNKMLAAKASAYSGMDRFFPKEKILLTGNPVRQDILDISAKRKEALAYFGLSENKKTVLAIGGSLGARTINESIAGCLETFAQSGIQLVWQTGKGYFSEATNKAGAYPEQGIKAFDFISRMDLAYAVADIIVSRAGASSISELCLVQKPAILIPSPNVAEDHQTKNAMALVEKNAAILIKDAAARHELPIQLIALLKDEDRQAKLIGELKKLALPNAAITIAQEAIKLAEKKAGARH
jgi:UDP-N-acetylglucosamine--N-acetylmuramyl-(pentapeptide) pyrophosphoryl-undecaprenol N-acetylglucosamine transferase